jgi:hypothetical protein
VSARSSTPVGVLDGAPAARVDGSGALTVGDTELQWWIGSAERWHRPDREVAVRQSVLDGAPVVQTSLRIPGGDARVHTYAVVAQGAEWVVLDVVNAGKVPVAVAVVARCPHDAPGASAPRWQLDGTVLRRDGAVVTVSGRAADAVYPASGFDEVAAALAADAGAEGVAVPGGSDDRPGSDGAVPGAAAAAAFAQVFAVAHGTGIRVLVALGPAAGPGPLPDPHAVAAPEAVIRGWRRQLDTVCRFRLADDAEEESAFARRCRLLLRHDAGTPADLSALAAFGHAGEAARRLDRALSALRRPVDAAEALPLLVAASDVVAWTPDAEARRELARLLADAALQLAGWARPRRLRRSAGGAADGLVVDWAMARLLARTGELDEPPADEATLAAVAAHRAAPAAGAGDGAALLALRAGLVGDDAPGRVAVLPGWQAAWSGRALEAHDLPTTAGSLSFAVRWHGTRPALLWQLEVGDGTVVPPVLDAAALDPAFTTSSPQGEALLAAPPS